MRAALLLIGLALIGCNQPIQYTPDTGKVTSMGRENAARELVSVISERVRPEILNDTIEVTDVLVRYKVDTGPTGVNWVQLVWDEIGKVVLYRPTAGGMSRSIAPEHRSFIVEIQDAHGNEKAQILFHGRETAQHCIDLLESFRAARRESLKQR